MKARDAGRAAGPPPPPPPSGPSFLRRHPLLAGFGVLAALSLFAAYWPASAIVTGIVVAARASGADRVALGWLQRGARLALDRVRRRGDRGREPDSGAPEPAAPMPGAPEPAAPSPGAPNPAAPSPGSSTAPSPVTPPSATSASPGAPRPRRSHPAARRTRDRTPVGGVEIER